MSRYGKRKKELLISANMDMVKMNQLLIIAEGYPIPGDKDGAMNKVLHNLNHPREIGQRRR